MILRALPDANKDFAWGGFFGGWVNGRKSGSGGGLEKRDVSKRVHCNHLLFAGCCMGDQLAIGLAPGSWKHDP